MVLPAPRSQLADSAGLGRFPPPPICAKAALVNNIAMTTTGATTNRFCMESPSHFCRATTIDAPEMDKSADPQLCANHTNSYNRCMPVFDEKQEELEHYETMMGVPRGRLAVTMDTITDAMALVGQHGVYCQSQRWPGKPVMDIQIIMKSLTDAKELIQSVMEELKKGF